MNGVGKGKSCSGEKGLLLLLLFSEKKFVGYLLLEAGEDMD